MTEESGILPENKQDAKAFLILHLCDGKKYEDCEKLLKVDRTTLQIWWKEAEKIREDIGRTNRWYSAKRNSPDFKFTSKRDLYEWFDDQPRHCDYCKIEEYKLQKLFDFENPILETARGRGRYLELERKDAAEGANEYSRENCVLACYLCNNHKSDLISEKDHRKYFARQIKQYLEDKYLHLNE